MSLRLTHLSVDVSPSLQQPEQTLWVATKGSDVSRRLGKARGHGVHPAAHLDQLHDTLQLCETKKRMSANQTGMKNRISMSKTTDIRLSVYVLKSKHTPN